MSRSATPATQNEATPHMKPPKTTPSAELTIGTAIWPSRGRLRTVSNGCGRLRTVEQPRANTPSTPRPPEWNGNPCYAFGNYSKCRSVTVYRYRYTPIYHGHLVLHIHYHSLSFSHPLCSVFKCKNYVSFLNRSHPERNITVITENTNQDELSRSQHRKQQRIRFLSLSLGGYLK